MLEVLLTLESVVDNLAECLKNQDLLALLTRYDPSSSPSPLSSSPYTLTVSQRA